MTGTTFVLVSLGERTDEGINPIRKMAYQCGTVLSQYHHKTHPIKIGTNDIYFFSHINRSYKNNTCIINLLLSCTIRDYKNIYQTVLVVATAL